MCAGQSPLPSGDDPPIFLSDPFCLTFGENARPGLPGYSLPSVLSFWDNEAKRQNPHAVPDYDSRWPAGLSAKLSPDRRFVLMAGAVLITVFDHLYIALEKRPRRPNNLAPPTLQDAQRTSNRLAPSLCAPLLRLVRELDTAFANDHLERSVLEVTSERIAETRLILTRCPTS